MSRGDQPDRVPFEVTISPEPSPAERAAIFIALARLVETDANNRRPLQSAWASAGRRESLFGIGGGPRSGWGRGLDREWR